MNFTLKESEKINETVRNKLFSLGLLYDIDEVCLQWLKMSSVKEYFIKIIVKLPIYFNVIELSIQEAKEFLLKFRYIKTYNVDLNF